MTGLPHPLDPLSADEMKLAIEILRATGELGSRHFFSGAHIREVDKSLVADYKLGDTYERQAVIVGHDRDKGQSFEAIVLITDEKLVSLGWIDNGQAPVSGDDVFELYMLLLQNEDWVSALKKRGIEDMDRVHIEPWVAGIRPPNIPEGRVLKALAFLKVDGETNYYARPIEGIIANVDVDNGKVVVEDHGVHPLPDKGAEYAAAAQSQLRDDIKPLEITQPDGPSFEVSGQVIKWQKWQLRASVHPFEGLVLHDIRYNDDGCDRSILHRASLSDMIVPYGDASPLHFWKHALDAGETALGNQANSLKLGCDCLGEIYYFDAVMLGSDGEPYTLENAICLHEEDYGILWKHTNPFDENIPVEVRRSRRLVVSMIHTVGNYEYGFFWYFYQDGNIQMEIKLTGIIGVSQGEEGSSTSPLVAPGITSPIHQHLFCFRLDFNLDGAENSVIETNIQAIENDPHPYGTGFQAVPSLLKTEEEAKRVADPSRSRSWRIINPNVKNRLGQAVGYKLLPQATPILFPSPDSISGQRGHFAQNNLWVTPHRLDEHYAGGGPFSNLKEGMSGLGEYTKPNRSVDNEDIVVWHTFGVTHVPRPEDWPIMPVEYAGFMLMPTGFFDQNPSLDVPPSKKCD